MLTTGIGRRGNQADFLAAAVALPILDNLLVVAGSLNVSILIDFMHK